MKLNNLTSSSISIHSCKVFLQTDTLSFGYIHELLSVKIEKSGGFVRSFNNAHTFAYNIGADIFFTIHRTLDAEELPCFRHIEAC